MADPYVGEIKIFPYGFVPYGFLACQGQVVSASQYQALFALIGSTYGGDGRTIFKTPNLAGLAAVGLGVAPNGGTYNWTLGGVHGQEGVTLVSSQYPAHNHVISHPVGSLATANAYSPQAGSLMANTTPSQFFAEPPTAANTTVHPGALSPYDGGGATVQPHLNCQPFLVLMPCIVSMGTFPIFT
jgi:microcystin-dependent protein